MKCKSNVETYLNGAYGMGPATPPRASSASQWLAKPTMGTQQTHPDSAQVGATAQGPTHKGYFWDPKKPVPWSWLCKVGEHWDRIDNAHGSSGTIMESRGSHGCV